MTLPPPPPPPLAPAASASSSTGKWIAVGGAVVAIAVLSSLATWKFMQKPSVGNQGDSAPQAAIGMTATPVTTSPQATPSATTKEGSAAQPAALSQPAQATVTPQPAPAPCSSCGNIESIRRVSVGKEASGAGAVIGGVAGGLLGNQIGSGSGRTVATIAGVAGGAYAGHQVEKSQRTQAYEISVRMDDGSLRKITQSQAPEWQTGDRVRVVKGVLRAPGA